MEALREDRLLGLALVLVASHHGRVAYLLRLLMRQHGVREVELFHVASAHVYIGHRQRVTNVYLLFLNCLSPLTSFRVLNILVYGGAREAFIICCEHLATLT